MAPVRLVLQRQLELIVEFAEKNRDFALGNLAKHSSLESREAWEKLAKKLNKVSGGNVKTAEKWKRYWHLWKCRSRTKAADNRRYIKDGSNKLYPISELEARIVRLVKNMSQGEQVEVKTPLSDEAEMSSEAEDHQNGEGEDNEAPEASFNRDDDVPRWVYSLEERRIAAEERIAAAVNGLATTNQQILECMQGMAATHAQLVELLDNHFNQ